MSATTAYQNKPTDSAMTSDHEELPIRSKKRKIEEISNSQHSHSQGTEERSVNL